MLVDLPENWIEGYPNPQLLREHLNEYDGWPGKIRQGLYHTQGLFNFYIEHLIKSEYPFNVEFGPGTLEERVAALRTQAMDPTQPTSSYGSCDRPLQVITKYPILQTDSRPFLVAVNHIAKHPGEQGGWRWHKNGPYIGDHEPQCEYLDDEEGFEDGVWMFHIYEMK